GARFLVRPGTPAAPAAPPIVGSAASSASSVPVSKLVVYVVGAVRRPGLYRVRQGARIADAVGRAGGSTPQADLTARNLAAPAADGEQVVVPRRQAVAAAGVAPAGGAAASASPSPTAPVQLSVATAEQPDTPPGVGPITAQKII